MKVGTDGVLLGAWAGTGLSPRRILDIGTGTGLIAIMMAQRFPAAEVVGVDIDSVEEARRNGDESPWGDRLEFGQCPVQEFHPGEAFDLIVSNPPFFVDSLLPPDEGRSRVRHTLTLSFEDLCRAACRLLNPGGRFAVVLPLTESEQFLRSAVGSFVLCRRTVVRTTPRRPPKRVLLELERFTPDLKVTPPDEQLLSIGTGRHEEYTGEYRALTGDFYLKF